MHVCVPQYRRRKLPVGVKQYGLAVICNQNVVINDKNIIDILFLTLAN